MNKWQFQVMNFMMKGEFVGRKIACVGKTDYISQQNYLVAMSTGEKNKRSGRRDWFIARVYRFYRDGFRQMTVGRRLWALIIIKVIVLLFVFKLFFFPDLLQRDYDTDAERSQAVRSSLLRE